MSKIPLEKVGKVLELCSMDKSLSINQIANKVGMTTAVTASILKMRKIKRKRY